jgi:hypothetical protein
MLSAEIIQGLTYATTQLKEEEIVEKVKDSILGYKCKDLSAYKRRLALIINASVEALGELP